MIIFKIVMKLKSDIKNIIFLSIGCTILIAIIWKIGVTNIYQEFLKADRYLLVYSFFIILLSVLIKAYRWGKLFTHTKMIYSCKIYFIGTAINQIMPTGSGEVIRSYIARDKLNIPIGETAAPIMIERLADTTFLIALSFIYITYMTKSDHILQLAIPSVTLFAGYSLLLRPNIIDKILNKISNLEISRIPIINKIINVLYTFKDAIVRFKNKEKIIWYMIILTIIGWYVHGLGRYILLLAFGYDIQIFNALAITAISEIIGTFSFLPGGLGAKDISFGALLVTFGIPIEIGITIFLVFRIMIYIQLGVLAFISIISFAKLRG